MSGTHARRTPLYDQIGRGYAQTRREDPRIARCILEALGDASTVVNVGAGAGSYEPRDRYVIAIEPSDVMASQRPPELAPAIRASAGAIPLRDQSVEAAIAILTIHHWDGEQQPGVGELRRIARGPVVIVTYDPEISGQMWLMADYLPEVPDLDSQTFPKVETLAGWLGGTTRVETIELARDTPDWMLGSFWAHPERVLDQAARAATSGFARMPAAVVARVIEAVRHDLESGAWDRRYGHLRELESYDAGLRLVVNLPTRRSRDARADSPDRHRRARSGPATA
jgi:hypothetical protein